MLWRQPRMLGPELRYWALIEVSSEFHSNRVLYSCRPSGNLLILLLIYIHNTSSGIVPAVTNP